MTLVETYSTQYQSVLASEIYSCATCSTEKVLDKVLTQFVENLSWRGGTVRLHPEQSRDIIVTWLRKECKVESLLDTKLCDEDDASFSHAHQPILGASYRHLFPCSIHLRIFCPVGCGRLLKSSQYIVKTMSKSFSVEAVFSVSETLYCFTVSLGACFLIASHWAFCLLVTIILNLKQSWEVLRCLAQWSM